MGGGGSVQAMIDTIRSNKTLLGRRKNVFEQLKENEGGYDKSGLKFKTPTASEMQEFRQAWNLKVQEMRKRKIMALALSLLIAGLLLYGLATLITESL